MDPESIITFAEKAENRLHEIRSGILACRQGGSSSELETQLRGIRILRESAASLGLTAIENVLETFDQESDRISKTRGPLSDEGSRDLLDLLAHAEAEVLKARLAADDNPINIADFIDRSLIPGRLYKGDRDPEGLFSTIPTIATVLFGVVTGHLLKTERFNGHIKAAIMVAAGLACLGLAYLWNFEFPINKNLWTKKYLPDCPATKRVRT